jgi:hypothetical protein
MRKNNMRELIAIGTEVQVGPDDEDGRTARVEAIFVYRNFIQYVVTWWENGVKRVETVESPEITILPDDYTVDRVAVFVECPL